MDGCIECELTTLVTILSIKVTETAVTLVGLGAVNKVTSRNMSVTF